MKKLFFLATSLSLVDKGLRRFRAFRYFWPERRATGDDFRKKLFLGYDNGKKVYSIGRGSIYATQKPPRGEVWEYE
jgi:hypothetical protein